MFQIATDIDVPALTAADVAVRVDTGGRPVFVIPDDVTRALRRAGKAGWREVPDWAYGEGDRYPTGGLRGQPGPASARQPAHLARWRHLLGRVSAMGSV